MAQESYYIEQVKKGNSQAYTWLVNRYQDMVYSIALKITGDPTEAEDAAQEAFLKAYHGLQDFRGEGRFSTWLYSITFNSALNRTRKKRRLVLTGDASPDSILEAEQAIETDHLVRDDQKKFIREALDRLIPADNLVLTLFYLEELSIEEIVEITNFSAANIKVRLHRGRQRLHRELNTILKEELNSLL